MADITRRKFLKYVGLSSAVVVAAPVVAPVVASKRLRHLSHVQAGNDGDLLVLRGGTSSKPASFDKSVVDVQDDLKVWHDRVDGNIYLADGKEFIFTKDTRLMLGYSDSLGKWCEIARTT